MGPCHGFLPFKGSLHEDQDAQDQKNKNGGGNEKHGPVPDSFRQHGPHGRAADASGIDTGKKLGQPLGLVFFITVDNHKPLDGHEG